MGFKQLKEEAELLDVEYIDSLPQERRICKYKRAIIEALTVVVSICSKIPLKWTKTIAIVLSGAILAMQAVKCEDDSITL